MGVEHPNQPVKPLTNGARSSNFLSEFFGAVALRCWGTRNSKTIEASARNPELRNRAEEVRQIVRVGISTDVVATDCRQINTTQFGGKTGAIRLNLPLVRARPF